MKILAFDSSSSALSVAILDNGKILAETTLNLQKNHSTTLMTTIDFLLNQIEMQPSDLTRIAVAQGPGSYTGLRLAATVAKTLAYSLNLELVGVSSLYALAANVKTDKIVVPILDARRGNAYAAAYQGSEALIVDQYVKFDEFLSDLAIKAIGFDVIFTGETANFRETILAAGFDEAQINNDEFTNLPSAIESAKSAEQLKPVDVHSFAPNYLKKVEAEEKWLEKNGENQEDSREYVQRL